MNNDYKMIIPEVSGYKVDNGKIVFRAGLIDKPYIKEFNNLDEVAMELNEMLNNAYKQDDIISQLKIKLHSTKVDTLREFINKLKDNQENTTMDKQIVSLDLIETILKEMMEVEK